MNSLVNISEGASLALHGLVLIANKQPQRVNVKTLAKTLNASEAHMAKVFQKLSKANIVKSVRGPSGGFALNKPAEEISFFEIYEIIDGKINLGGCPLNKTDCSFQGCIFDNHLSRISNEIKETFIKIKLSDF